MLHRNILSQDSLPVPSKPAKVTNNEVTNNEFILPTFYPIFHQRNESQMFLTGKFGNCVPEILEI